MTSNPSARRLRIGIDAHAIGERAAGNERFIANVARELREICDHELVLFFTDRRTADRWPDWHSWVIRPRSAWLRIPLSFPVATRMEGLDVLLVQYAAPRWPGCPVVTVVHDVSFAEHPGWFSPTERLWMRRVIPATMRRAAKIVTVSEFSKSEICRIYGLEPGRIVVAYDGVDPSLLMSRPAPGGGSYFLAVGNVEPRKNLGVLLDAFSLLRTRRPEERLVIAGRTKRGSREQAADGVSWLGYVPDEDLAALMQHAVALCYPSLYEGFGLPAIEAMSCGTPALVSDIPVMQEVCGEAAVLLSPTDPAVWADAMERIARDDGYRSAQAERGKERAAAFTWKRAAEVVLEALEAAARGARGTRASRR